eukprot:scaffold3316_cov64-Phaeocystis_antarctica.AAC.2
MGFPSTWKLYPARQPRSPTRSWERRLCRIAISYSLRGNCHPGGQDISVSFEAIAGPKVPASPPTTCKKRQELEVGSAVVLRHQ